MDYKKPTEEQLKLMRDYANICTKAIDIIIKCENDIMLQHASARIHESMSWFNSYVINGGKVSKEN